MMDYQTFANLVSQELEIERDRVSAESRLFEDANLDSMGMYELLLLLEEAGFPIDEESLFSWVTFADVYRTIEPQESD